MMATAVTAATTPSRTTVTGKIKVLKVKTITVHGTGTSKLTCRITTVSPRVTLRGFTLGTTAKITCSKGVLLTIVHPALKTATPVTSSGTVSNPKTVPEPSESTTPPTGGVKIAPTVNGNGKITAIGGGQIEFGGDTSCMLTSSSPSVSGYRVGSLVSYTCAGGTLTAIGAGEGA
jgi:hypothetical protein